ncbi:MAG: gluconate 2-dehydrogenase subunit 3 family protein [Bacteroidetes bacterium]|nr:gluconate 2-dehydrogenase subunit 3 family protein [Bacteroidota bacterium]
MNRRDSLKALGIGTLSASALLAGCGPKTAEENESEAAAADITGRQPYEIERDKALFKQTFFDKHEMATIAVLADLIIPRDARSGSATDAKVPEFIEFIVKDEPEHQLPMRGGLKWLDVHCLDSYDSAFIDCKPDQQKAVLDQIAYPALAKPEVQQGVAFFNKMRDLTAIGFFTTKMGIEDLGYKGNTPGKWEGVPEDVLKQYGLEGV